VKIRATGVHHITLRVNDLERSREFYEDVLGFVVEQAARDRYRFSVGPTRIVLRPPLKGTPAGDRFSEFRVGVDHLAFAVEDPGELEKVVEVLRVAGIETQGIQVEPHLDKRFVCFRDPDNVQWEFFEE